MTRADIERGARQSTSSRLERAQRQLRAVDIGAE